MPGGVPPQTPKTNAFSIVAIIGGFVLPIVGVIFGILSLNQIKKTGEQGKGLALTGIIAGGFFTLCQLIYLFFIFSIVGIGAGAAGKAVSDYGSYKPEPYVQQQDENVKKDEPSPAPVDAGEFLAPGGKVQGEAATLPWNYYDNKDSVWTHQVTSIEAAPDVDIEFFKDSVPTISDYDVVYIRVESNYVSGSVEPFSAFYTDFKPVRADGTLVSDLILIGVKNCESNSVGSEHDFKSAPLNNCIAAATPKGSEAPAGVAWAPHESEYSAYGGSPALLLK